MIVSAKTYRLLRPIHKWAGLIAAVWLFVMGVTGIALDHHGWRWLNQITVPAEWTSERVARLVPGTVMRHIAASGNRIVGASERGTWFSDDGENWTGVQFEGMSGAPQVNGIVDLPGLGFVDAYLASDDGLWVLSNGGSSAVRAGLDGKHLTGISEGHEPGSVLLVEEQSRLLSFTPATAQVNEVALETNVSGLSPTVPFHRFIMDIHFGRALLPGNWSIWLNDLGGLAMAILSASGLGYWYITRRGRRRGMTMKTQRGLMRWLFRAHAPIIGLLGAIPILYIAATALPLNHIYGFLDWSKGRELSRSALPAAYSAVSFDHEIDGAVAFPGDPNRLMVSTRFGVLESLDGGESWITNLTIPVEPGAPGARIFRVGETLFVGFGGGDNFARDTRSEDWGRLEGTSTAITSAARRGDGWLVKNSQAIYRGAGLTGEFVDSGINYKAAAPGTPLFLYLVDVHVGLVIHSEFKWANDLFAILALVLALSGPVMWLRRKWV